MKKENSLKSKLEKQSESCNKQSQTTSQEKSKGTTVVIPSTTKPLKLRGVGTMNLESGEFDFKPYGEGVALKKKEKKAGDSSFYETENSVIAHLKVDKKDPDAVGKLYDQLGKLTKDSQPKEPKCPLNRPILDNENLKVWVRGKESKVIVQMTIDNSAKQLLTLSTQLFNLAQEVNKCFAINKAQLER
jgi:hypothetical protein